ncbi:MAG: PEP-CTERM sorting domain-containing protein [Phycisphaerae bacterium]|jgi:hypothetical protein|nr:PEP-CTERM sorting domain-containing protein [Phycisphaerae bacterium]
MKNIPPLLTVILFLGALALVATSAPGAVAIDSGGDDQYTFGTPDSLSITGDGLFHSVTSTVTNTGDAGVLGSQVTITAANGSVLDLDVAWRTRTDIEVDGRPFDLAANERQYVRDGVGAEDPGIALAWDAYNVSSDVMDLSGLPANTVYVMEMTYDESVLLWHESPDDWRGSPSETLEEGLARLNKIYLGWFALGDSFGILDGYDEWVNAVEGNSTTGANAVSNVKTSYATFASANSIDESNLDDYLGSFGVDIANDTVWAVLDHNSIYGVVPEPTSIAMLAMGGLAVWRRRRK